MSKTITVRKTKFRGKFFETEKYLLQKSQSGKWTVYEKSEGNLSSVFSDRNFNKSMKSFLSKI